MKVIIVGGVAGGASCAALRRLDEKVEILMVPFFDIGLKSDRHFLALAIFF